MSPHLLFIAVVFKNRLSKQNVKTKIQKITCLWFALNITKKSQYQTILEFISVTYDFGLVVKKLILMAKNESSGKIGKLGKRKIW